MHPLRGLLKDARKGAYALGAFNVYDYETIFGVVKAEEEEKIPVIAAFGERYLENMDFESVALIAERFSREVSTPIALHGGSGTPEDVLRECVQNGICKINVDTEISTFVVDRFRTMLASEKDFHYSKLSLEAIGLVTQVARKYIGIFKR